MTTLAFTKQGFLNLETACQKEWLETNLLGGYASSSMACCNTRKYHGLLVANIGHPAGRHVLLSTVEETLQVAQRTFPLSTRKHPGVYFPEGWKQLKNASADLLCPTFEYQAGEYTILREILMLPRENTTLLRYSIRKKEKSEEVARSQDHIKLSIKPLLAYRHFHSLTSSNMDMQTKSYALEGGFMVQPYNELPPLYTIVSSKHYFYPAPDWYYNIEYQEEKKRGYAFTEDLFQSGLLEIEAAPEQSIVIAFSTALPASSPSDLWDNEIKRRTLAACGKKSKQKSSVNPAAETAAPKDYLKILSNAGEKFLITTPQGKASILAGYHWFDSWGRDSMIALPGLTFCAGREKEGLAILQALCPATKNGLVPNVFNPDGINHAYNSVDASLWYIWAVQQLIMSSAKHLAFVKKHCWPAINNIITCFMDNKTGLVSMDSNGLLSTGNEHTQLTWMDAMVNGQPVTPRHGCPVEINALWYNALCFAEELSKFFDAESFIPKGLTKKLRESFKKHFYLSKGYLADVWRKDFVDTSIRPNQIFAVSLPYSMLDKTMQKSVVRTVQEHLLTSFGLRTLSMGNPAFHPTYFGTQEQRDTAYHQGTVWPWLLGAYTEAALKVSSNPEKTSTEILHILTPLFAEHIEKQAGLGFISEVFDATAPFLPGGCVAQAWSVAEAFRLLLMIKTVAPESFEKWQAQQAEV